MNGTKPSSNPSRYLKKSDIILVVIARMVSSGTAQSHNNATAKKGSPIARKTTSQLSYRSEVFHASLLVPKHSGTRTAEHHPVFLTL